MYNPQNSARAKQKFVFCKIFFFFNEVVSTLISLKCYLNFAEVSTKTKKKNSSIVTGKYKIMETLLE